MDGVSCGGLVGTVNFDGWSVHTWEAIVARLAASLEAHPWVSRTDRMRFLLSYARELRPEKLEVKALWRDVAVACNAILHRFARRGIPVA